MELESAIAAFLANGGKITPCPQSPALNRVWKPAVKESRPAGWHLPEMTKPQKKLYDKLRRAGVEKGEAIRLALGA